jgi:hydroxypyruvate reductase
VSERRGRAREDLNTPPPTTLPQRERAARDLLRAAFAAGVAAVHPSRVVAPHLPELSGPVVLLAAGKAAVPMAEAFLAHRGTPAAGVVVTRHGEAGSLAAASGGLRLVEAGHPLPDASSERAASLMLGAVRGLTTRDRVVFLVSGGGSALLALPRTPLTLSDKRTLTAELLASGASIAEINCVRKKLSAIKGGRLALAAGPARIDGIAISDVPGDEAADIASGPASPDATTLDQAREVLRRHRIDPGARVGAFLSDPANETPKPGHPAFARVTMTVCGRSADALAAAAKIVQGAGYAPILLGDAIDRPAHALAAEHTLMAHRAAAEGGRIALISGGETTVHVGNRSGRGGRNGEYLLSLAIGLAGAPGIFALAADTDGIDGTQDNAGAFVGPTTLSRSADRGLDARALLAAHCSWDLFAATGDLFVTGPTGTNVNDLRIVLVDEPGP